MEHTVADLDNSTSKKQLTVCHVICFAQYDIALDDALASVYDNVHMRAELAVAEERLVSFEHLVTQATECFHGFALSFWAEMG